MQKSQITSIKYQKNHKSQASNIKQFVIWNLEFGISPRGFTLLEMMISTGIFAVVIIIAVGAMLSLNQAQVKAGNIQNIQDNIRFTLESMTKEFMTGVNFNSAACGFDGCTEINFVRQDGISAGYCLDSGAVKRFVSPVTCTSPGSSSITSSAVLVSKLYFYVTGKEPGPADGQPRITITIESRSVNPTLQFNTALNMETTVTARLRDL